MSPSPAFNASLAASALCDYGWRASLIGIYRGLGHTFACYTVGRKGGHEMPPGLGVRACGITILGLAALEQWWMDPRLHYPLGEDAMTARCKAHARESSSTL